jgi:hypothetical protein
MGFHLLLWSLVCRCYPAPGCHHNLEYSSSRTWQFWRFPSRKDKGGRGTADRLSWASQRVWFAEGHLAPPAYLLRRKGRGLRKRSPRKGSGCLEPPKILADRYAERIRVYFFGKPLKQNFAKFHD